MRLSVGTAVFSIGLILQLMPAKGFGQEVTTGADTVAVPTAAVADTAQKRFFLNGIRNWDRPAKAAALSALLPGLGQAYNRAYWKIPVVYATGAVLGYFWVDNNNRYQDFRQALIQRSSKEQDAFIDDPIYGAQNPNGVRNLRFSRDFYRRNRDLTILLSALAYTLNVAEAYVHAHMREFDVSDNLSLRLQPNLIRIPDTANLSPGLTLTLYTK